MMGDDGGWSGIVGIAGMSQVSTCALWGAPALARATRCAVMSVLASLHGRRGGVQSKKVHAPAESEGFALAVASAMYWGKLRDSTHPDFWRRIVAEVLHAESTTQQWADNEMIAHFHGTVLCGIGQEGLQLYLQRKRKKNFSNPSPWARRRSLLPTRGAPRPRGTEVFNLLLHKLDRIERHG